MGNDNNPDDRGLDRRRFVQAVGATMGAGGLAGCGGGQDSGDGDGGQTDGGGGGSDGDQTTTGGGGGSEELGERVPPLTISYFASASAVWEDIINVAKKGWSELGLQVKANPVQITTFAGNIINDKRSFHLGSVNFGSQPDRIDPHELTRDFAADFAGANGLPNWTNYANCEYTHPAIQQAQAADTDERRNLVYDAHEIFSGDFGYISMNDQIYFSAANEEALDIAGTGKLGFQTTNRSPWVQTSANDGEFVAAVAPPIVSQRMFLKVAHVGGITFWSHLPFSPLVGYNSEIQLENVLAEDYEVENEFRTIRFTLRDATFHDGAPITAEDVKFSFSYIHNNADIFPHAATFPFADSPGESITAVDEQTVEFEFSRSYPIFLTREAPKYGIVPKERWTQQGAMENPESFKPAELVGSGPLQVTDFKLNESATFEPFPDHPTMDAQSTVTLAAYKSTTSAVQAFKEREIQVIADIQQRQQVVKLTEDMDAAREINANSLHAYGWLPYSNIAPTKFPEFRHAIGAAINRQLIKQVALGGKGPVNLFAEHFSAAHPWRPPDSRLTKFTDSPTGDVEAARQVLRDAGFGWDDEGRLHYPPDADLEPLWPEGEQPTAPEYPCLTEDGKYAGEQ